MSHPATHHEEEALAGRLVTRVTADVEALNKLFSSGVVSALGDLFTLVAISVAMFVMDWKFAIVAYIVIPLVVLASHLSRTRVREAYRETRTDWLASMRFFRSV